MQLAIYRDMFIYPSVIRKSQRESKLSIVMSNLHYYEIQFPSHPILETILIK